MNIANLIKNIAYIIICFLSIILIFDDYKKYNRSEKNDCKRVKLSTILIISLVIGVFSLSFNGVFSWSDNDYYQYAFIHDLDVVGSSAMTIFFKIIKKVSTNFDFVLFVCSFIGAFSILIAYRHSKCGNPLMIVFVFATTYFLQFCQTALKQIIAISILNISFVLFENKKYLISVLLIPVACLFHTSALIAVPILVIYLIAKIRKMEYKLIIFMVIAIVLGVFIFDSAIILKIFSFSPRIVSQILQFYDELLVSDEVSMIAIKYIPFYVLTIVGFVYWKRMHESAQNYNFYLFVSAFGSLILFLSFKSYWMSRMLPYFLIYCGELLSILYGQKVNNSDSFYINIVDKIHTINIALPSRKYVLLIVIVSFGFTLRELLLYYPIF